MAIQTMRDSGPESTNPSLLGERDRSEDWDAGLARSQLPRSNAQGLAMECHTTLL